MEEGKRAEEALAERLTGAGFSCSICPSGKPEEKFDLVLSGGISPLTVEVKRDLWARRSGNLALEYRNPKKDKPSGIMASRANLWVYDLGPEMGLWICRRALLKTYFFSRIPVRDVPKGGDGNSSFRLYRLDEILPQVFARIDLYSGVQLAELILEIMS